MKKLKNSIPNVKSEVIRLSMRKQTLLKAKTENLIRLAKWLKLDIKDLNHHALAGNIHFHLLYLS